MRYVIFYIAFYGLGYYYSCNDPAIPLKTGEPHITNKTWNADSIHYSTSEGLNFIPPPGFIGLMIRMNKGDSVMLYHNGYPNYFPFTLLHGDYIEPDTFLVHPYDTLIWTYENLTHDNVMLIYRFEMDTFYMSAVPD